jgi:hypothetical protein
MLRRASASTKLLLSSAAAVSYLSPMNEAKAADALYWIMCSCDPTDQVDANQEISTQVSPYSEMGGGPIGGGFAPGFEVIIQQQGGSDIARWKFTLGQSWQAVENPDYVCGLFDDPCIDLTSAQQLPRPPWIIPPGGLGARPQISCNAFQMANCQFRLVYTVTNGAPVNFANFHTQCSVGNWPSISQTTSASMIVTGNGTRDWAIRASNLGGNSNACLITTYCSGGPLD